jgi:GT2 family glycosyltransferase
VIPERALDIELSGGIAPVPVGSGYRSVHLLVRYLGRPVGWVRSNRLTGGILAAEEVRTLVAEQLGTVLPRFLLTQSSELERRTLPPISVVVCTRDRTDHLRHCLPSLLSLDYPTFEIIVVDNAPLTDATARLVQGLPVRYVQEPQAGLDRARTRGVEAARYDIVAFTDDDVSVDRLWLRACAAAFDDAGVSAVTGTVAPKELETEAQWLFETVYGGMGHGLQRRTLRRDALRNAELIRSSAYGCGANMAFRRSALLALGGFDPALDVGTPSGGAGDLDMLHRILAHGYTLVYDPAVLVWHTHRRSYRDLRRQIFDNGRGFGSYLFTVFRNRTVGRGSLLRFALVDWLTVWLLARIVRPKGLPRGLVLAELAGALLSPLYYRKARAAAENEVPRFMEGATGDEPRRIAQ